MKGIIPSSLARSLVKVASEFEGNPFRSITDFRERIGQKYLQSMKTAFGITDSDGLCMEIPLEGLRQRFTRDEVCKMYHSFGDNMHNSVEKAFRSEPDLEISRKIGSSTWRWGYERCPWNELVDIYDGLRECTLGSASDEFEIRLDHTTGSNERGYSTHGRVFLDGVFGCLIYHRGIHMLTIGFSFMSGRRLLLQQVQSANRSGNRALYRLPKNRTEFALERLQAAFPHHQLYVVCGEDLTDSILSQYRYQMDRIDLRRAETERNLMGAKFENRNSLRDKLDRLNTEYFELWERISHLERDQPRITASYANCGRFTFGTETLKVNGLRHFPIAT